MKIVYAAMNLLPSSAASSGQIAETCSALAEQGVAVSLVAGRARIGNAYWRQLLREKYSLRTTVHCKSFRHSGRVFLSLMRCWFCAMREVRWGEKKADLLYTRSIVIAFLCAMSGVKAVYEVHDLPSRRLRYVEFLLLLVSAKTELKVVLASPSHSLLRYYRRYITGPAVECRHVPHGAHVVRPETPPSYASSVDEEAPISCAYVGSLGFGKGLDFIVSLARYAPDIKFRAALLVRDEASFLNNLEDLPCNISLRINLTKSEVAMMCCSSDVLLLPVEKHTEKFSGGLNRQLVPLRAVEYLGFGKPIIASKIRPNQEVLGRCIGAVLLPLRVERWAKEIYSIATHQSLVQSMSIDALRWGEHYSWRQRAKVIISMVHS